MNQGSMMRHSATNRLEIRAFDGISECMYKRAS
jgi:hypothetical protein